MDFTRITDIVDRLAGSAARDIRIRSDEMDLRITFGDAVSSGGAVPLAEAPENTLAVDATVPGVAYLSPEPGAPAFVRVGDRVSAGQTLLLIEAMKSMLTVAAPCEGTIAEICARNEAQVGLGEVLFRIKVGAA